MQPDGKIVEKVTIVTKTAASTKAMSDSVAGKTGVKKSVEKAVARASLEVRVAKITKSAAEQSTAGKADAAEQFKAVKAMTKSGPLWMQLSKR